MGRSHRVDHVYATRLVLEVEATRLGGAAVGTADLAAMRRAYDAMVTAVRAGRTAEALDRDEELPLALYAAAATRCSWSWSRTSGSGAAPSSSWASTPRSRSPGR